MKKQLNFLQILQFLAVLFVSGQVLLAHDRFFIIKGLGIPPNLSLITPP